MFLKVYWHRLMFLGCAEAFALVLSGYDSFIKVVKRSLTSWDFLRSFDAFSCVLLDSEKFLKVLWCSLTSEYIRTPQNAL